ncbi:unnamed protein product, partial [Didymodactylos carnosus]
LNSGVMLMNLTRIREVNMIDDILKIYNIYEKNITWGDQCLLNIYFNQYPERLLEFTCEWNYRPDHCMYENNCPTTEIMGIKLLHGCRGAFHNEKYQEFKAIYRAIDEWNFESNLKSTILHKIKLYLSEHSTTNCGKISSMFTKHIAKEISAKNRKNDINDHGTCSATNECTKPTLNNVSSIQNSPHLALVICGDRDEEVLVLLKSIFLFTKYSSTNIYLHLITDEQAKKNMIKKLSEVPLLMRQMFIVKYYDIIYPSYVDREQWINLFRYCGTQRIFLPDNLPELDHILYFDTDTLLLQSLDRFWSLFNNFNQTHIVGLVKENEVLQLSWYPLYSKHPFVWPTVY